MVAFGRNVDGWRCAGRDGSILVLAVAHVHLFFDERMGHGVVVAVHRRDRLPLGYSYAFDGQGAQGRFILAQTGRAGCSFLKGRLLSGATHGWHGSTRPGRSTEGRRESSAPPPDRDLGFRVTGTALPVIMAVMRGQVLVGGVDGYRCALLTPARKLSGTTTSGTPVGTDSARGRRSNLPDPWVQVASA